MVQDDETRASADDALEAEVAKYRRAAEETLNQLDWCVSYLYRIRKPRIARAVDKNRTTIRRRMLRGSD
jgi:hypothetical protein